jgi:hypothetical protein
MANSISSKLLSEITKIPDAPLNEKLIPSNDNYEPTALSREKFEAESILAPRDYPKPGRSPLVITAVLSLFLAALLFAAWFGGYTP